MLYENIEIINSDCVKYFNLLKNNEWLLILDDKRIIIASFFKTEDEIYEYFYLFNIKKIKTYKEFKYPLSFLFRNEPNSNSYVYHICSNEERSKTLKQNNLFFVNKELESDNDNNAKSIHNDILKDGGKFISFGDSNIIGGLLVCAVSSDEDYYWAYITTNLDVQLSSCVGGYEILDGDCVEFNILKHLIDNEPEYLIEIVHKSFEDSTDAIFTPVIVNQKTNMNNGNN